MTARGNKLVTLRDVLFVCHAKPKDKKQEILWKHLVEGTMKTPDTWEVASSAGGEPKRDMWLRLLSEEKLGAMAMLRNLRNMQEADVPLDEVRKGLKAMKPAKVLPFRFISAATHAPDLEPELEEAMLNCLGQLPKWSGKTTLLVDVSGSMNQQVSGRSEIRRLDAAVGLAMIIREICEDPHIYTFHDTCEKVPPRRGFALRDVIGAPRGCTELGDAIRKVNSDGYDRLVVITDEQSRSHVGGPLKKGYMINVACYQNGVGYGPWTHIDGWSENVVRYITEFEAV